MEASPWQTKRYRLRTSRDGKLVPTQVTSNEEHPQSYDSTTQGSHRSKRSDADNRAIGEIALGLTRITTPIGAAEGQEDPIRAYRAEIEALPQLPPESFTTSPPKKRPQDPFSQRTSSRDRALPPNTRLERQSSKGSVKAARIRAQQSQKSRPGDFDFKIPDSDVSSKMPTHQRSELRSESASASEDEMEESEDYRGHRRQIPSDGSEETLHLPKMTNRGSVGYAL